MHPLLFLLACGQAPALGASMLTVSDVRVNSASCLPVLPIPNRPPFAVVAQAGAPPGEVLLNIQQLPDAGGSAAFTATIEGATLRLTQVLADPVESSLSCDLSLRLSGIAPGTYRVEVSSPRSGSRVDFGGVAGVVVR